MTTPSARVSDHPYDTRLNVLYRPLEKITLASNEGFVVPRGVVDRTRAPDRTVILMVENAGIVPTGD